MTVGKFVIRQIMRLIEAGFGNSDAEAQVELVLDDCVELVDGGLLTDEEFSAIVETADCVARELRERRKQSELLLSYRISELR